MIGEIDDSKAPLLDHLIELRSRLLKCVYALFITGGICFYFSEQLFAILVHPLKEAFGDAGGKLVYTKLYEAFFVQIKIAAFGAFCLSFPIIANQLWAFVAPGLGQSGGLALKRLGVRLYRRPLAVDIGLSGLGQLQ